MKQIEFADSALQIFFSEQGLACFDDFFDYSDGKQINKNTKRNVIVIRLKSKSEERVFYMKRFHDPHFKDMFFTFQNYGRICSQGQLEWNNARYLLNHGIETYHPVCFGQQTFLGFERRSFFVTEQLKGICLTDFLNTEWTTLPRPKQEDLIRRLAEFFCKIHASKISLPDLYVWHIFLTWDGREENVSFSIIDLHRMSIRVRGHQSAAKNLGAFLYSMPDERFDTQLREIFMEIYLQNSSNKNPQTFLNRLHQREIKLRKRRGKPISISRE